jgi:nucleoid-associated protein YgaU
VAQEEHIEVIEATRGPAIGQAARPSPLPFAIGDETSGARQVEPVEAPVPGQVPVSGGQWYDWYLVVVADTMSDIALWWYGRGEERWWRRIWLANRRTIGENPNQLDVGGWLKLPYHGFPYHVERGDTLSMLAQWVYGDEDQWQMIRKSNPWIPDPDRLEAHWWIWVP